MARSKRRIVGLALAAFLGGTLAGCRSSSPPPVPVPPQPLVPVATAPALPIHELHQFHRFVDAQLENFTMKRAGRMGMAAEPAERELVAQGYSPRLGRRFSPIEAHFNAGEELFEFDFTSREGFGTAIGGKPPNIHRVHRGGHGGPDATSCRSCHHRGGDDGAGEYTEAALTGGDGESTFNANERNAPAVLGAGAIQILAREISEALAEQVRVPPGTEHDRELVYQGVSFGTVHIRKDGTLDTSRLTAIDGDLVVRPFGWKGSHATLRRFAEEAFQVHHGMQSEVLTNLRRFFGPMPYGASPATAAIMKSMGDGPPNDPDRDGATDELVGRFLTSISVYLALLPLPVIEPPKAPDLLAAFRDGEAAFRQVGCDSCHKPYWLIKNPVWREVGEGNSSDDDLLLDLRKDIQRGAQLHTTDTLFYGQYPIFIYSDLRRHDMGEELADRYEGPGPHPGDRRGPKIPPSYFLTRPLWGLADTAPYLHDGRALTIPDAIRLHGGEAAPVRDAYLRLPKERQRAMHVFLLSLTRPPIPEVVP
ncbi:MAG: di-heme oxidoredictase family protein [Myxococcales bacterium]|nr:hypothetical protein [Myxococcota bacterium]MDW8284245.1 di-heme oxidoredictase family protein [Myxococcales bacterium]